MRSLFALLALFASASLASSQQTMPATPSATTSTTHPSAAALRDNTPAPPPPTPSRAQVLRGANGPWRANNDLLYYHLSLRVDPVAKTIAGTNQVRFRMLAAGQRIQLDLTPDLTIDRIDEAGATLGFTREDSAVFIDFPRPLPRGSVHAITVAYHGHPVSKGRFGGMSFETDPAGRPWIFTADEDDGCSIYWPCKDQWLDEPQDGMDLSITVPNALTDVSNGRFVSKVDQHDGTTQWNWHVSYPINSYDVALNIGTYTHFAQTYTNREHPEFRPLPLDFYCLPEDLEKARTQFAQATGMLDAFEHYFGEYPFARDGYKLVQVPYSGMEHQSAVSYGNHFHNGYLDRDWTGVGISTRFDFIIIHESGHEWFGNAVSAADRADMWIHEGWDTYLETLFVEYHYGRADALKYTSGFVPKVRNRAPIIGERGIAQDPPQDMYFKAALMIATLRNWLATAAPTPAAADREWFALLHAFYQHFQYTNSTTEQVVAWWNEHTRPVLHTDLNPFFNQYLRRAAIPALELCWLPAAPGDAPGTHTVLYKWQAEEPGFAMPVQFDGAPGQPPVTLHPTDDWQTFTTPLTADELHVATGLFFVNVSKT